MINKKMYVNAVGNDAGNVSGTYDRCILTVYS